MTVPTPEEALAFCIMLEAGLPAEEAILYFLESDDRLEIAQTLKKWLRSRAVKEAQLSLSGKSWMEMNLEERIEAGLKQNYNAMAYLLYSQNYITADPMTKNKLDTARAALEAKKAGQAGQADPLSRFLNDLQSGKLSITKPATRPN